MKIVIEKNIPIPVKNQSRTIGPVRLALIALQPKESFFREKRGSINQIIQQMKKTHPGLQYTTRTVKGGFRVWRIK